jgi:hypothetical protein
MTISWYSLKEHKPEDFDEMFELIKSKYNEIKVYIASNDNDFYHNELQEHFVENCLKNIEYISIKKLSSNYKFSYYLKLFRNKICIRNNDLTNYDFKKFLTATLIGKIPMIYFWSFIGASLKESLTDWTILVKIAIMLIATYLVSVVINKFINSD